MTRTGKHSIVVGFDGSPPARSAALWAAEEAASRDCGLLLVHVVRGPLPELVFTPMSTPLPDAVSEQSVRFRAENDLANLTAECNRLSPGLNITTRIEYGHPTDVLGEIGRDAELLVVGSSGRSGLTRALLGSTAADLAVHHERPVVVVREAKAADGRVVVGVDGSQTSATAIDFAFEFASRRGRDLLAVHAWSDMPIEALAPTQNRNYNWNQVHAESEAVIAAAWQATRKATRTSAWSGTSRSTAPRRRCSTPPTTQDYSSWAATAAALYGGQCSVQSATPCSTKPSARWPSYTDTTDPTSRLTEPPR